MQTPPYDNEVLANEIVVLLSQVENILKKLHFDPCAVPQHKHGSQHLRLMVTAYDQLTAAKNRQDEGSVQKWKHTSLDNGQDAEHLMKCIVDVLQDLRRQGE